MATEIIINLALGGIEPSPVVLPSDRLDQSDPRRVIAVWCEAQPMTWHTDPESGAMVPIEHTLGQVILASRADAVRIKRPLAIWTDSAEWDISVTGATRYGDQWWMRCARLPGETLADALARYEQGLKFCPLAHTVMVVGMDLSVEADGELEHLVGCAALARGLPEVIGFVWVGTRSIDTLLRVQAEVDLPGPPPIIDIEPLAWGEGPTP
jgi:hypothetical protein